MATFIDNKTRLLGDDLRQEITLSSEIQKVPPARTLFAKKKGTIKEKRFPILISGIPSLYHAVSHFREKTSMNTILIGTVGKNKNFLIFKNHVKIRDAQP